MKRVFIVAPNIGYHMGSGGGVRVALAMARVFEELGMQPYLVALRGYDIRRLCEINGIELKKSKPLYLTGFGSPLRAPFPVQVKLLIQFLKREIGFRKPDIIIFHDDVPRFIEKHAPNSLVILYSHFPYGVRIKLNVTDASEIPQPKRKLDVIYRKVLRELIFVEYIPEDVLLIANSTVTKLFMEKLWKRPTRVIYPPFIHPRLNVEEPLKHSTRRTYAVILATINPNKRIGDVVRAFRSVKNARSRLFVVGYRGHENYMEYLLELVDQVGLTDRVSFILNASENGKWSILLKAKAIVSAAHFEPFGINVVEGMYAGCIPIVYRGTLSGPWIDIVNKGRHGLGFRYIEELAELLDSVFDNYDEFAQKFRVEEKAKGFSFEYFKESFIKSLK